MGHNARVVFFFSLSLFFSYMLLWHHDGVLLRLCRVARQFPVWDPAGRQLVLHEASSCS